MNNKCASNYQDFLKLFAIFAMTIDHLGLYFYPEYDVMRIIGRMVMPIFCFCAGYNFHNRPRHILLLFASILFVVHSIVFNRIEATEILFGIYLGQLYIFFFQSYLTKFTTGYWHVILICPLFILTNFIFAYGTLVIAIMILGYIAKHENKSCKLTIFIAIILSLLHYFVIFQPHGSNIILILIQAFLLYLLMIAKSLDQPIELNIKTISRNSLFIYFIQILIMELMWSYFYGNY
jgi:hypothetical protein